MSLSSLPAFARYFRFHRWISGFLGRWPGACRATTLIGSRLNPARPPAVARHWPAGAWARYLRNASMALALLYRFRDFADSFSLAWDDPDDALAAAKARGGLILTYHHPFAYHLPFFVGRQGIPLDVLALSPEESPLYPLYAEFAAQWFSDSEPFFGGGRWVFLFPDRNNDLRSPLRQLKNGGVVISVHDFPNFYPGAKSIPAELLGRKFAAPEGIIASAVKAGLPIAVGFTQWPGDRTLQVSLRSLNDGGRENVDSAEILRRYLAVLEGIIQPHPEFWEGWGALPASSNPGAG